MTRTAQHHHYIPRFVLKEFTYDQKKRSLWLYNIKTKNECEINIRNAAIKDLYTINKEGIEPDAVEKELAKLEDRIAPIYREILKSKQLPTGIDYDRFLYFIAFYSSRMPIFHDSIANQIEQICENIKVSSEQIDARKLFAGQIPSTVSVTLSNISVTPLNIKEVCLRTMIDRPEQLLPIFKQAKWTLMLAGNSSKFICSDNPLNIDFLNRESILQGIRTASLPLSKEVALLSGFSTTSLPSVEEINDRTRANADRFIFLPSKELPLLRDH